MSDQLTPTTSGTIHDRDGHDATWTDLAKEMWSYLTGQGAAVNYSFVDMTVEVPRDTGADAPRATWKIDGTLRITTEDAEHQPSSGS